MDATERQLVLDHLDSSRTALLQSVGHFTHPQWQFRPTEGQWSPAENVEHVILVETRILAAIQKMLTRPPQPEKTAGLLAKDAMILNLAGRETKFQAPEPVQPKGTWPDPADLMAEFHLTRSRTAEFASSTDGDLRSRVIPHMAFGDLDCYQWLLLLGRHCARHTVQIEEVKAHPGFPQPPS